MQQSQKINNTKNSKLVHECSNLSNHPENNKKIFEILRQNEKSVKSTYSNNCFPSNSCWTAWSNSTS